jgi:hypothetical protein
MTDYANPDRPDERLSNADRQEAINRLADAQSQGRLSASEFGERSTSARAAVTRGDLAPLFHDLPGRPSYDMPGTGQSYAAPPAGGYAPPAAEYAPPSGAPYAFPAEPTGSSRGPRALGGAVGATIMAFVPFIALGLFFLTGHFGSYAWSWLWFLLVPIAGIIIYGPGAEYRSRR